MERVEDLAEALQVLDERMGGSAAMVAAFEGELARMQSSMVFTGREIGTLSRGLSQGLRKAFDGLVFDGMKLSEALRGVGKAISETVYNIAMRPVSHALGGVLAQGIAGAMGAFMPFAQGGAFTSGKVMPFARGGIVSAPTMFPMRGGRGLMGEAGPEAILPLARGADGRLGVQSGGGGRPVQVVMNISTPDVQGFQRSQSQIAAQMGRALARGQRNR
ncbi:phage tail tape measure protein [Xinfangfangia sp. CPCC 101601]|uniref:Phage tail tape measure protein n=1 Tax=Pseudogemmobacter lacusdianii TaxID=3069608 RepID=A0ABU0W150_9RHOB|nr:phage tail tape measure protein [Xinfangfangia sp. CPCC 101601]MDQ2067694.1 phage tail tape measure protein [Xinfangfangia sp. CPCC 101601]